MALRPFLSIIVWPLKIGTVSLHFFRVYLCSRMYNGRYILTFPFLPILGDGTLDFQEFLKVVTHKGPGDDNSDIMEAFKMIDKDGDSQLSADELRHVMRNLGENMTEEDIEEMIREADIDGDGKISYEGNSNDLGPELQCLLKVKEDLSKVLIFQHAILNAK